MGEGPREGLFTFVLLCGGMTRAREKQEEDSDRADNRDGSPAMELADARCPVRELEERPIGEASRLLVRRWTSLRLLARRSDRRFQRR